MSVLVLLISLGVWMLLCLLVCSGCLGFFSPYCDVWTGLVLGDVLSLSVLYLGVALYLCVELCVAVLLTNY